MKSVMVHQFGRVPKAEIQRSQFNRSHGVKTTFDAGKLIPIFVDEALPGDTYNLKMSAFARLATPIVPFMDNLFLDSFFFAVPVRLVWDNWQKFNGEQVDPGDSTEFLVPQIEAPVAGFDVGSLHDYLGIPVGVNGLKASVLWHRAYNLIYNEWFRDENLQDSLVVDKGDSSDYADYNSVQYRNKRPDYFTTCLPWPQKNDDPVPIPAPYTESGTIPVVTSSAQPKFHTSADATDRTMTSGTSATTAGLSGYSSSNSTLVFGAESGLKVELGWDTTATINALRQAFQLQRLYERDARGGTRYTEIVRSHFGVISPDARLQRPEYLGGGSTRVNIHPIAQTSSTDATTPQGNLAAMGTAASHGDGFVKSFTEHCLLLGIVNVRADLSYQQGLNRMFSRRTRWDFYWPSLAHIGEQAVLNKEIYAQGPTVTHGTPAVAYDDEVFGYQERYAEYKYKPSVITGIFRSNVSGSLDKWHLAQDFVSLPALDNFFMDDAASEVGVDRVIATPSQPQFLFDAYFDLKCARPMPTYSIPGMVDHF